jgi:hypothetical protein
MLDHKPGIIPGLHGCVGPAKTKPLEFVLTHAAELRFARIGAFQRGNQVVDRLTVLRGVAGPQVGYRFVDLLLAWEREQAETNRYDKTNQDAGMKGMSYEPAEKPGHSRYPFRTWPTAAG